MNPIAGVWDCQLIQTAPYMPILIMTATSIWSQTTSMRKLHFGRVTLVSWKQVRNQIISGLHCPALKQTEKGWEPRLNSELTESFSINTSAPFGDIFQPLSHSCTLVSEHLPVSTALRSSGQTASTSSLKMLMRIRY